MTFFFAFILFCYSLPLFSQDVLGREGEGKSKNDKDSIPLFIPNRNLGKKDLFRSVKFLNKQEFVVGDNLSYSEILNSNTNISFLSLGALGNSSIVNNYGILSYPNTYQSGTYHIVPTLDISNFELYPFLGYEGIEVFDGLKAYLMGYKSNGTLFNFVPRLFNTKHPFVQIWIGQGGYDYLGSGAVFAQNFFPNTNFYLIYNRYWSAGRFDNSNSDKWNISAGFRLFPSNWLNIWLENRYSILNNGLFGGINESLSEFPYENNLAIAMFEKLERTIWQNDFSINFIGLFDTDSSVVLQGGLIWSYSKTDFEVDDYLSNYYEIDTKHKTSGNFFSANSRLNFDIGKVKSILGIEFFYKNRERWIWEIESKSFVPSTYALFQFDIFKNFASEIGVRFDYEKDNPNSTLGLSLKYNDTSLLSSSFDLVFQPKRNSLSTPLGKNILLKLNLSSERKDFNFACDLYTRYAWEFSYFSSLTDSLGKILGTRFSSIGEIFNSGANIYLLAPIGFNLNLNTKINLNYTFGNNERKEWLPNLALTIKLFYRLVRGSSRLDFGPELEILSPFKGAYFMPISPRWVEYPKRIGWQFNGVNIFANAKLGNAFLNVSLRNLFSANYYYLPFYPEYDRNIRISVYWSFND
ncbi:MAG: hypothetical protein N2517_07985 [Ignavibacteria bacterium]|nr:hypothetical protein [Ignavibacteria bacterium]